MAKKAGQGKEEEESRARQQKERDASPSGGEDVELATLTGQPRQSFSTFDFFIYEVGIMMISPSGCQSNICLTYEECPVKLQNPYACIYIVQNQAINQDEIQ
ncbi:hypothetical protein STEG23_028602 [Scotinomys teguina]